MTVPTTPMQALAKIPFKNVDSTAAPPCAVLEVTGAVIEEGVAFLTCRQPGSTLGIEYAINSSVRVDAGGKGICYRQGDVAVAFDSGAPAAGEIWGPRSGQWTASRGYPAIATVHAVRSAAAKIMHAGLHPLVGVVGVADSQIDGFADDQPGQAMVRLYVRSGELMVAASPTTTFTGHNVYTRPVPAGRLTRFARACGLWIAAADEVEEHKLVKPNALISANGGEGLVKRWTLGGGGDEEQTDPVEEFMARNRTSVDIDADLFCLALRIDGHWYIEPWECGAEAPPEV